MAAVLAATFVVGACVQGLVGLGLGMVAAPIVALTAPELMPDLLIWLALMMPLVTLVREHHDIDWRGLAWSLPWRIPGTVVGVALVSWLAKDSLGIVVGVFVLLAVLLTVRTVVLPVNRVTLSVAGFVAGISGTTTSIGGPPMAILYQHEHPSRVRSTLAVFFVAGAAISLAGLGLGGLLDAATLLLALAMVPALVLGFQVSRLVDRWTTREGIRRGVLGVCAVSAVALLGQSLFA